MAYFDDLTGITYDKLLAEYQAAKKAGTYKGGPFIASDGQHYNLTIPDTSGDVMPLDSSIKFGRGTNNGQNDVSYSPDQQNGYVYKDDDSFGGFLANGLKYVGAPLAAAYGLSGLLGAAGGAGTGASSALGVGAISAESAAQAAFQAAGGVAGGANAVAASQAAFAAAGGTGALTAAEIASMTTAGQFAPYVPEFVPGLAAGAGGVSDATGAKGLLDAIGGVKGALTIGGGLLGAASAKDGTTTQTKEPWAPMQPYLLDNANNIKNWYAQNGNGGIEANRLAAQIPAFNQQQAQAGQGLLSMANQYAKRKGL